MKGSFALARDAEFAQFLDSQREQAAHPFLFKEFFEGFRRRDFRRIDRGCAQFFFRRGKIERDVRHISAALLPPSGLVFVHHETVHAEAQVSSQSTFLRIKLVEELAFEKFDEKSLGEILRRVRGAVPSQAHIFIDGLPIRRA